MCCRGKSSERPGRPSFLAQLAQSIVNLELGLAGNRSLPAVPGFGDALFPTD